MADDSSSDLILVANAPASRRMPATTAARLGNIRPNPAPERVAQWMQRLERARTPLPALEAYSGDTWTHVRAAFEASRAVGGELWVASPGVGLVRGDQPMPNYIASFDTEHPDRCGDDGIANELWWEALAQWNATRGLPGGLAGLVRRNRAATYLFALGADALAALHADLWEAREAAFDPDRILVISAGASGSLGLGESLLRVESWKDHGLGGARHTLNARLMRHLVETFPPSDLRASVIQKWLRRMESLPKPPPRAKPAPARPMGSIELESYLRESLAVQPNLKPATLLRRLREAGRAPDAVAFQRLYQSLSLPLLA